MIIRKATDVDMPAVISLLEEMSLPVDGIAEHRDQLYVLEVQGAIIGAVGYEAYPPDALLRSLVIVPSMRGQGYGRQLISHVLKQAQIDGIRGAYALTTTIPDLLCRSGFDEVSRSDAPEALSASVEFRGACPVSARLFHIPIDSAKR